jgi:predicted MFS family arabinose efflux permease
MGIDLTAGNATRIVGPALGGLVYELAGITGTYAVCTIGYIICLLLLAGLVPPPRAVIDRAIGISTRVIEGLRYVRQNRALMGTMAITVAMNIWGFPYAQMVPVVGRDELDLSAFPIGLLLSSEGVGALAGSLLIAAYGREAHFKKLYLYGAFTLMVCVAAFGLSRVYELSLVLTLVGGFGIAGFSTMQSTLPYVLSAPEMRARVMGVLSVAIGTGPLGVLHLGLLGEWLGAANALVVVGIEGAVALLLIALIWREAR